MSELDSSTCMSLTPVIGSVIQVYACLIGFFMFVYATQQLPRVFKTGWDRLTRNHRLDALEAKVENLMERVSRLSNHTPTPSLPSLPLVSGPPPPPPPRSQVNLVPPAPIQHKIQIKKIEKPVKQEGPTMDQVLKELSSLKKRVQMMDSPRRSYLQNKENKPLNPMAYSLKERFARAYPMQ